jgi:hypothetical protein
MGLSRRMATSLLTSRRHWPFVILDLAIEDIRACEHRGATGSLGNMKVVSEAHAQGASVTTRRFRVRVLIYIRVGRVLAPLLGLRFLGQPHAGRRVPD